MSRDGTGETHNRDLVVVTDSIEKAFRVGMPLGWENQATLCRSQWGWRTLAEARSPSGETVLFIGDSHLPYFIEPNEYLNEYTPAAFSDPSLKIQPFVAAESFVVDYVRQRYGDLPGFRLTGLFPCPAYDKMVREMGRAFDLSLRITAGRVTFEFSGNEQTVRGWVNGATYTDGTLWMADLSGGLTAGDPACWDDLLLRMVASVEISPVWQEREKAHRLQDSERNHYYVSRGDKRR